MLRMWEGKLYCEMSAPHTGTNTAKHMGIKLGRLSAFAALWCRYKSTGFDNYTVVVVEVGLSASLSDTDAMSTAGSHSHRELPLGLRLKCDFSNH